MKQLNIIQRREAQAKWYHANKHTESYKAKRRAKQKRHMAKHTFKRLVKSIKKRDKSSNVTAFDLWKIAKLQRLVCPISGRKLTNENISPDHILALTNGGKSTPENIRLLTIETNIARNCMSDIELIRLCHDICRKNGDGAANPRPQP
jgi:hypothetical protein